MQRLNVEQTQIRECIEQSLFAINQTPHLQKGEILLLQLVKRDASKLGKLNARIEFALVYDHCEYDHTGEISRQHWPQAGRTWKYILRCSDTIPTVPFSLENLLLARIIQPANTLKKQMRRRKKMKKVLALFATNAVHRWW